MNNFIYDNNQYYILIVDDEPKACEYFKELFSVNFNILTACGAYAALEIVSKNNNIAVIISDSKMPGYAGIDLLLKFKNEQPHITRILTTAYTKLSDSLDAINKANIFSYITKPWDMDEINKVVNSAITYHATNKAINMMTASIAHEMRNPLSSIRFMTNNLSLNPDTTEISNFKKEITNITLLAKNIIDMNLHQLANKKINHKDYNYNSAQIAIINAILNYGYKDNQEKEKIYIELNKDNKISAANITHESTLIKNIDIKENDFIFLANDVSFKYIIFNIVNNALFYAQNYSNLLINISFEKEKTISQELINKFNLDPNIKKYNAINISDNGPGIKKEIITRIFESYFTTNKKGGTGLGLHFCNKTMNDFGGKIICQSEVNKYTKFSLLFPIITNDKKLENSSNSLEINNNIEYPKIINHKKILLVDDQKSILLFNKNIIRSFLGKKNQSYIEYDLAYNGKEALGLFKKTIKENVNIKNYDIIITDIEMPKMNGLDLIKKIRKIENKNRIDNTPVIILSSATEHNIKQKALELGANYYIHKSVNPEFFIKIILNYLVIDDNNITANIVKDNNNYDVLENKKILIADDNLINKNILRKYLEKQHASLIIELGKDGYEMYDKYTNNMSSSRTTPYDLIITDINMHNLDGVNAVIKIRKFEQECQNKNALKVPIIAYSGDGSHNNILKYLKSGINDFFIKGDEVHKLTGKILFWLKYKNNLIQQFKLSEHKVNHKIELKNKLLSTEEYHKYPILNKNIDKKILLEITNEFIIETVKIINELKKNKNINDFIFNIHMLKGSCAVIGLDRLYQYIKTLENYGNNKQWPENKNWLAELELLFEESKNQLRNL